MEAGPKRNDAHRLLQELDGILRNWALQPTMMRMAGLMAVDDAAAMHAGDPQKPSVDLIRQDVYLPIASDIMTSILPPIRMLAQSIALQLGRFSMHTVERNLHGCDRHCTFVTSHPVSICANSGQIHLCGIYCDQRLKDHGGTSCKLTGMRIKEAMISAEFDGRHMEFGNAGKDNYTGGRPGLTRKQTKKLEAIENIMKKSVGLTPGEEQKVRREDMHRLKPTRSKRVQEKRKEVVRAIRIPNNTLVDDKSQMEENRVQIESILGSMKTPKASGAQRKEIIYEIERLWETFVRTSLDRMNKYSLKAHVVAVMLNMRQGFPQFAGPEDTILFEPHDWLCLPTRKEAGNAFCMGSKAIKTSLERFNYLVQPLLQGSLGAQS